MACGIFLRRDVEKMAVQHIINNLTNKMFKYLDIPKSVYLRKFEMLLLSISDSNNGTLFILFSHFRYWKISNFRHFVKVWFSLYLQILSIRLSFQKYYRFLTESANLQKSVSTFVFSWKFGYTWTLNRQYLLEI